MTPDLLSVLGGGGVTAITFYAAMRKGLITTKGCEGCQATITARQDTQDQVISSAAQLSTAAITTLEKTTEIRLASGERQFKEIKDTMQEYNRALIDLTGSVNKLIGRHEVLMEHVEREHGNGKGEGKG